MCFDVFCNVVWVRSRLAGWLQAFGAGPNFLSGPVEQRMLGRWGPVEPRILGRWVVKQSVSAMCTLGGI